MNNQWIRFSKTNITRPGHLESETSEEIFPQELRTVGYEKRKLYVLVYQLSKTGEPISYHRIYDLEYERMQNLLAFTNDFYNRNMVNGKLKRKLTLERIKRGLQLPQSTVTTLVKDMASMRCLMYKRGKKWATIRKKPYLIIQQKSKSQEIKKPPWYIYGYDWYMQNPQN